MAGEAIDIGQPQTSPPKNTADGRRGMGFGERRDGPVEDYTEALRFDIPAHDVERIRLGVLASRLDHGNPRFAGPEHAGSGAIAEQGRGAGPVPLGIATERFFSRNGNFSSTRRVSRENAVIKSLTHNVGVAVAAGRLGPHAAVNRTRPHAMLPTRRNKRR
jgi:hypothetical protein